MRAIILAVALSLSACGPLAAVSALSPVASAGDKVVLEGERALVLAHNAYQAAAEAATLLVKAHALNADQLARLEKANDKALQVLGQAGGTLSAAERAAALFSATNEINRIIGR